MPLTSYFLLPAAILLGGCAAPIPDYLARPADPAVKVPAVGYQNVAAQTKTFRPVGPKDWEELNRRVAPKS